MTETASNQEHTLVLFYKFPKPGFGKQRLAASIGAEAAYQIGRNLLKCAVEDMLDWPGPLVFTPANTGNTEAFQDILGNYFSNKTYEVIPQGTGNLGERLNEIDQTLRVRGHKHIHYIGSDAPMLNQQIYRTARMYLDDMDYVLADSRDGGVTLMSARKPWPALSELPWSTPKLGEDLANLCGINGSSLQRFDGYYDVDELDDLQNIRRDLEGDDRPARRALMDAIDQYTNDLEMTSLDTGEMPLVRSEM